MILLLEYRAATPLVMRRGTLCGDEVILKEKVGR